MLNKRRKNFEQPGASFSMQRQSRMKQMQKEDSKMFDNPFFWPSSAWEQLCCAAAKRATPPRP